MIELRIDYLVGETADGKVFGKIKSDAKYQMSIFVVYNT